MPTHTVSRDLKAWISALFYHQGFKVKEICSVLGIKKTLIYQALLYTHAYGVPYNCHAGQYG